MERDRRRRQGRRCGARAPATCVSPWAASRRSCRARIRGTPEWNTAALGENKRRLAVQLFWRLQAALRPGGARALRPGQVVSGRAAAALVAELLLAQGRRADLDASGARSPTRRADYPDAARKCTAAPRGDRRACSSVGAEHVFPAYEDAFYYVWRERQAPAPTSKRPLQGSRIRWSACALRASSSSELDAPVGYVLPIARSAEGAPWHSGPWFLRGERCYLIPGDSPIGLSPAARFAALGEAVRLSAPVSARSESELRAARALRRTCANGARGSDARPRGRVRCRRRAAPPWRHNIRPRSCAPRCAREERDGVLHVFMPPTRCLEDYLELVAAVESCAKSCGSRW